MSAPPSAAFGNVHSVAEITIRKAERCLDLVFEDGASLSIPAELLRVESPSAEVQGHGPDQKKLVSGRAEVAIIGAEPVGNYAIKLVFDDLHDSGIYTWDYLYDLGSNQDRIWADYLAALAAAGLSRDPASVVPAAKDACGCGGGTGGCG